jgi:hypothetical protein
MFPQVSSLVLLTYSLLDAFFLFGLSELFLHVFLSQCTMTIFMIIHVPPIVVLGTKCEKGFRFKCNIDVVEGMTRRKR